MDEQIKLFMDTLQLTEEEAKELIKFDKQVDKMTVAQAQSDLSAEQKKNIKQYKNADKVVNAYGKEVTRERKTDNEKVNIINILSKALLEVADGVNITNPQREIEFIIDNRKFKIVLSAPRK